MADDSQVAPFDSMPVFRPPLVRSAAVAAAATLDRSLFSKTVSISAARILNIKKISQHRTELTKTKELLRLDRLANIRSDPDPERASKGGKCFLLSPQVKPEDPKTWSDVLQEAIKTEDLAIFPYDLRLEYDYWNYRAYAKDPFYMHCTNDESDEIMDALMPEDARQEIPSGFAIVGHIAHLNLHDEYLPYKKVIAEVILDKNPTITTVINKIEDVGAHSEFRTFSYEVLAGPDNMDVEISEGNCTFRFDYSKVYWNSRLQTEHKRLVDSFNPGEVVCDVMAGVGPFAVPAGKKGVFVWANDLNPESYASMKDAITRNKVQNFVHPFCEDGHAFIHHAADELLQLSANKKNTITISAKRSRNADPSQPTPSPTIITIPQTINHFVMNLPATAIDFLGSFNGLYHDHEDLFEPHTDNKLPMIHIHCFSTKSDDNVREGIEICQRISEKLGYEIKPGDEELVIFDVREVAPKKRMFCASFRLPAEVAFRERKPR